MLKKYLYSLVMIPLLVIGTVFTVPLTTFALSLPSPFLGVNISFIDKSQDFSSIKIPSFTFSANLSTGSLTGDLRCTTSQTTSGICTVYSSSSSNGLVLDFPNITNGSISVVNNQNAQIISSYDYFYQYEFILDNFYIGSFDVSINGGSTITLYVNGSSVTFTSDILPNSSVVVSNVNLNLSPSSFGQFDLELGQFALMNYSLLNGSSLSGTGSNAYVLQSVNLPSLTGKFNFTGTPGNGNGAFYSVSNTEYYVLFLRKLGNRVFGTSTITLIGSGSSNPSFGQDIGSIIHGNIRIEGFSYTVENNGYVAFNSSASSSLFDYYVPLYFGTLDNMPDYIKSALGLLDSVEQDAKDKTDDLLDKATDFTDKINITQDFEDSTFSDLDSAFDDIDSSFSLTDFGDKFLGSADFVRSTFNSMTEDTPYGSMIYFSLILGFSLLLFGRAMK